MFYYLQLLNTGICSITLYPNFKLNRISILDACSIGEDISCKNLFLILLCNLHINEMCSNKVYIMKLLATSLYLYIYARYFIFYKLYFINKGPCDTIGLNQVDRHCTVREL